MKDKIKKQMDYAIKGLINESELRKALDKIEKEYLKVGFREGSFSRGEPTLKSPSLDRKDGE